MSKVLCLCPTYGRRPELLATTLACFSCQDHQDRFLLIYDDLGNYSPAEGKNWKIVSNTDRAPNLPAKYMKMFGMVDYDWTHYAVWDDDDLYLPWHLSSAVEAAGDSGWAKQSTIWTTYGSPLGSYRKEHNTGGRFHGSIVVSRELFTGYEVSDAVDFDFQLLNRLQNKQPPEDHAPSYVYRWRDAAMNHLSASKVPYSQYKPEYSDPVNVVMPCFGDSGLEVYTDILLKEELHGLCRARL